MGAQRRLPRALVRTADGQILSEGARHLRLATLAHTKCELAKKIGISAQYLGDLIAGKKLPDLGVADDIERALDIPLSYWRELPACYPKK